MRFATDSMQGNESSSLELDSTDVTVASVAALGQEHGDDENDTEIMDIEYILDLEYMDLEYILQSESDSNDGDFSDTDSDKSYQPDTMNEFVSDSDYDEVLDDEDLLELDEEEVMH